MDFNFNDIKAQQKTFGLQKDIDTIMNGMKKLVTKMEIKKTNDDLHTEIKAFSVKLDTFNRENINM